MPPNILPLLVAAGGVAYLIHSKKGKACPDRIVLDETKAQQKFTEAIKSIVGAQKSGEKLFPDDVADKMFSAFAPLECKNANTVIVMPDQSEVVAKELYAKLKSAFEMGESMMDFFGHIKGPNCPKTALFTASDENMKKGEEIYASIDGSKNPDKVADEFFELAAPIDCKWNEDTMIESPETEITAPAPDFWGAILSDVLEAYMEKGFMSQDDARDFFSAFKADFKQKTGREWKDPIP